jgi:hypothetical protein
MAQRSVLGSVRGTMRAGNVVTKRLDDETSVPHTPENASICVRVHEATESLEI